MATEIRKINLFETPYLGVIVTDKSRERILGAIEEVNRDNELEDWCYQEAWMMINRLTAYAPGFKPNGEVIFYTSDSNYNEYVIYFTVDSRDQPSNFKESQNKG